MPPVRAGGTARFRCSFVGDNITVQYVSWTKFNTNGKRTFVYEYSQHPPLARAYHDFIGRAMITNADMNDNRYSYLRNIDRSPKSWNTAPPVTKKDTAETIKTPAKSDDQWSNVHESIYGIFSNSMRNGRKPDFKDIDEIFKGMDDKNNMAGQLKQLEIPVTRDDIRRILLPVNRQEPLTVPVRLSNQENQDIEDFRGFWPGAGGRRKRSVPVHHIDLQLIHVLLSDEATYECLVKPVNGPAVSSSMVLIVQGMYILINHLQDIIQLFPITSLCRLLTKMLNELIYISSSLLVMCEMEHVAIYGSIATYKVCCTFKGNQKASK